MEFANAWQWLECDKEMMLREKYVNEIMVSIIIFKLLDTRHHHNSGIFGS